MSHSKNLLGIIGYEDNYLKRNTTNTFFKSNYKNYSNFDINWITIENNLKPEPYGSSTKFPPNSELYFRFPPQGDIIVDNILRFKLYDDNANVSLNKDVPINSDSDSIGEFTALSLLSKIEFLYNDTVIAILDKNYIANYMKLSQDSENYQKYRNFSSYNNSSTIYDNSMPTDGKYVRYVSLPLPFWYTKSEGLGFPIWSLTDPNIGIKITLDNYNLNNVIGNTKCNIFDIQILAKYVNLGNDEKDKFKNLSLEYKIEQVEIVNKISIKSNVDFNKKISLPLNYFVKFLIWNITEDDYLGFNENKNKFEFDSCKGIQKTSIQLNGNQVISDFKENITRLIFRHNYFKCPETNINTKLIKKGETDLNIHTYSFCLNPLENNLSGFISTEKFNKFVMNVQGFIESNDDKLFTLNIYIIKNNIIRFKNGKMSILFN